MMNFQHDSAVRPNAKQMANREIDSSLNGAAFGAVTAAMTGRNIGEGAAMGAAAWAAGSAANMLIGNAVGFISSAFHAPTYETGMYVYPGNPWGCLTIGDAVWKWKYFQGPMSPLFAAHEEDGHGHFQGDLLGPLCVPLQILDKATATDMLEYSPSLFGGAPTVSQLPSPPNVPPLTWWQLLGF